VLSDRATRIEETVMDDFTCTLTRGKWYCGHDCDDPSHGRQGAARVYDHGHYYKPGQIISITEL
jgi:hypothetical protein